MTCPHFNQRSDLTGTEFANHLNQCSTCRETISKLKTMENEVAAMAAEGDAQSSSWRQETRQLLVSGRPPANRRAIPGQFVWIPVTVAACIALAVVVFSSTSTVPAGTQTDRTMVQSTTRSNLSAQISAQIISQNGHIQPLGIVQSSHGATFEAPEDGRLLADLGRDKVGLSPNGRFTLLQQTKKIVRLRLDNGTLACHVAPRQNREQFFIQYGVYTVRVVGTRFLVSSDSTHPLQVTVVSGTVEVSGPNGVMALVNQGKTLEIGVADRIQHGAINGASKVRIEQLLSLSNQPNPLEKTAPSGTGNLSTAPPVETPAPARHTPRREKLTDWQEMVVEGELAKAEKMIRIHLKTSPGDPDAWWLLATCLRKAGNWNGAVNAYNQVMTLASPARQDKARYRAGTILQEQLGNHQKAIPYLQQYVDRSNAFTPLRAEALVRLAQSYLAVGKRTLAARALDTVIADHGDSPVVVKAKRLKEQLQ